MNALKLYSLTLSGQGDTDIKFVEKDSWDWITALMKDWKTPCPESVLEKIKEEQGEMFDGAPNITRSTAHNDAALQVPAYKYGKDLYASFYNAKKAFDFVKEYNVEVIESYNGYIY